MDDKTGMDALSITPAILQAAGYKAFRDSLKGDQESYAGSWQKCVRDEGGKKYFINFNFYDMGRLYRSQGIGGNPCGWECSLQMAGLDDEMTVNTKIFSSNAQLARVESFCEKLFESMEFAYYEYGDAESEGKHRLELMGKRAKREADVLGEAARGPLLRKPAKPI